MSVQFQTPQEAKCVFKGIIFDVFQWQQKMYDGSMATFERLKRPNTALVLPITTDGKILLIRQTQPQSSKERLSLPGGRCEPDEDPRNTALRELKEETGFTTDDLQLLFQVSPFMKIEWTLYYYLAKKSHRVADQNLDAGERISLVYMDFEKFIELVTRDENFEEFNLALFMFRKLFSPGGVEELRKIFMN